MTVMIVIIMTIHSVIAFSSKDFFQTNLIQR